MEPRPPSEFSEMTRSKEKILHNTALRCLSVVVPVYNELSTIKPILKRLLDVPLPIEIIIVDDHSTDGTREWLMDLESNPQQLKPNGTLPPIRMHYQKRNQGKGACIREGVKLATGDLLAIQDADMEYDPMEFPRLVEPILSGDADVVYGSRFLGERRRVHLYWHTVGNKFLTFLSNIFTNLNLTDMETCYKIFKTEIVQSIPLRSNRFGFEPEITAKIAKLRCRIYEIPISYRGRGYADGKKINWKDGISAVYTILKFFIIDDLYSKTAGLRTLRIMEGAGKYNEWLFDQCRPFIGHRIIEIGSGTGNISKYLVGRELLVTTDVAEFYLSELRKQFGHLDNVFIEPFDATNKSKALELKNTYLPDSVITLNTIEHIEDHKAAFENLNHLLDIGGRAVVLVPAHQLLYSQIDKNLDHFRRYSKKSLVEMMQSAGFKIEKSIYLNMVGAVGWFVNGKILRRKLLPSRQVRAFDWLIQLLRIEKIIPAPFGLSVMVVANKIKNID